MSNPTARAIASIAVCGGCGAVAFAEPMFGVMSIVGIVVGIQLIWRSA